MIRMFIFVVTVFLNSYAFSQENSWFGQTLNFLKAETGSLTGNNKDASPTDTAGNPQLNFSGYISSWQQSCAGACDLPVGEEQNEPVNFKLSLPVSPGEAGVAKFDREFHFTTDSRVERIKVNFVIYAICPHSAVPDGEDPCPLRYFQTQIEIKGDAQAFCGASINRNDAFPFPVLMCAGVSRNDPSRRLGVSLHRIPIEE